MAGAGFKDFAVGEILTASDVDTYLMQQSVMRFADSAARGSALGTATGTAVPLAEGMVSYLDDINSIEVYDGTAWVAGSGGLVAVKNAVFTGTQAVSLAAGAGTAVTGLSITHTMVESGNKIVLFGQLSGNGSVEFLSGAFAVDGTLVDIGDAASSRTRIGSQTEAASNFQGNVFLTSVYLPGDTSSHTYTLNIVNVATTTKTNYVNRSNDDTNTAGRARAASTLTLMEVKV